MLNLKKGANINLAKESPNTTIFKVGLGWDVKQDSTIKDEFDVDVVAIITDSNDKNAKCHYYNDIDGTGKSSENHYKGMNLKETLKEAEKLSQTSIAVITKDNRDGKGDEDDETLFVNGSLLNDNQRVKVCVNIYEGDARKQVFGMVKNAYVKVYDDKNAEICKYDLGEDFSLETGVNVGEFYKVNGELKFKALGTGFTGDLNQLIQQFQ